MSEEISPLENHNWWMKQLRKDAKANRPEALRLADCLDDVTCNTPHPAAAELRRLHALNGELLEALKLALPQLIGRAERTARAAIAKAEGKV